jgi:hypothetical protein
MSRTFSNSGSLSGEERFTLLNSRRLPARLDVSQTAAILNFREHDLPVLTAAGILKPLGKPAANAPKYYAATEVMACAENRDWLDKATRILAANWKERNQRAAQAASPQD